MLSLRRLGIPNLRSGITSVATGNVPVDGLVESSAGVGLQLPLRNGWASALLLASSRGPRRATWHVDTTL